MNIKRLFKKTKRTIPSLTQEERLRMRSTLTTFMKENPVRVDSSLRHIEQQSHWSIITIHRYIKVMPIALLIAAVISGGTSFAAASSLPGEILYPVKININEKVAAVLALNDSAKAELETKLAAKRLEEAETLAAEGRLKEELRIELEQRFSEHADRVKDRIVRFETEEKFKDVAEIEARFDGSLEAHEAILARLGAALQNADADELALVVREKRTSNKSGKLELSAMMTTAPTALEFETRIADDSASTSDSTVRYEQAAQSTIKVAENLLAIARKYLVDHANTLSADIKADAEAKIAQGEVSLASAKTHFAADAFAPSFTAAKDAMYLATQATVLMRTSRIIDPKIEIKIKQRDGGVETEIEIENESNSSSDDSTTRRSRGSDDVNDAPDDSDGRIGDDDGDRRGRGSDDSQDDETEIESETEIEIEDGEIKIESKGSLNL